MSIVAHIFRVFGTNVDGRIDFMEFMVILSKIFYIFDGDKDNKISKMEMERVMTDLAGLFKDKRSAKDCFSKTFEEIDQNHDKNITREEFIQAILGDKTYSQGLSTGCWNCSWTEVDFFLKN